MHEGAPHWQAVGRYGYWAVDEYRENDPHNGVYGTVGTFRSRKAANEVAAALNSAYRRGLHDAVKES